MTSCQHSITFSEATHFGRNLLSRGRKPSLQNKYSVANFRAQIRPTPESGGCRPEISRLLILLLLQQPALIELCVSRRNFEQARRLSAFLDVL